MSDPKRLSKGLILDHALAMIDQKGLESLSARTLAASLSVRPMAIYHYFSGMEVLLDAVVERVLSLIVMPELTGHFVTDLKNLHLAYVGALQMHPNAIALLSGRRFNATGTLPFLNANFEVLKARGLRAEDIAIAFRIQGYFTNGALMAYAATLAAQSRDDFQMDNPTFLTDFPLIATVVPHLRAEALGHIMMQGIDMILSALEARWPESEQPGPDEPARQ